jgi:short-subunit dehydrogenase
MRQVYISSRTAKECEETAKELDSLGPGKCIPIAADMQQLSDVEKLVKEISSREKALHVLVNNAGAAWGDKLDAYPVRPTSKLSTIVIEFLLCGFRTKLGQKS